MDSLKPTLSRYLETTKRLNDVNAHAAELRDERHSIEMDLAALYSESQDLPSTVELKASRMTFQVKKPGERKKGWTLSKKQLRDYLLEILPSQGEEVMKEIAKRHEPKLTATDYSFDLKSIT